MFLAAKTLEWASSKGGNPQKHLSVARLLPFDPPTPQPHSTSTMTDGDAAPEQAATPMEAEPAPTAAATEAETEVKTEAAVAEPPAASAGVADQEEARPEALATALLPPPSKPRTAHAALCGGLKPARAHRDAARLRACAPHETAAEIAGDPIPPLPPSSSRAPPPRAFAFLPCCSRCHGEWAPASDIWSLSLTPTGQDGGTGCYRRAEPD